MDGLDMSSNEEMIESRVKRFLKGWEAMYLEDHEKEPRREDVPDDLKVLYKVYKKLKKGHIQESTSKNIEELLATLNEEYGVYQYLKKRHVSITSTIRCDPPVQHHAGSISKVPIETPIDEIAEELAESIILDVPVPVINTLPIISLKDNSEKEYYQKEALELPLEKALLTKAIPHSTVLKCQVIRLRRVIPVFVIKNELNDVEICKIKKSVKGYKVYIPSTQGEQLAYTIECHKSRYDTYDNSGSMICQTTFESSIPRTIAISTSEHSFRNKQPHWNTDAQTYTLDFQKRVTESSNKNFLFENEQGGTALLFGKTNNNSYVLDCRHPLRPDQAICAMMSTFDAVDRQ